jgi:5-formyltetrahydrofolate cyclo-ligase
MITKKLLREQAKVILSNISIDRRKEAHEALLNTLIPILKHESKVLSFCNRPQEIDTSSLNSYLFENKKLVLPKVNNDKLDLYFIENITTLTSLKFSIPEPSEKDNHQIKIDEISLILVPALLFDHHHYRLGYGKGYFDKLLAEKNYRTIGIGFKEQLVETPLPICKHDVKLNDVKLF